MLSDFLKTLLEFFEFLWPLRRIDAHERGYFTLNGKVWTPYNFLFWDWGHLRYFWRRTEGPDVGPGIYWRVPWFLDVWGCDCSWGTVDTGRMDLETSDGQTLTVMASALCRVKNVRIAMIEVQDYERTMQGTLAGMISEVLTSTEPEFLEPAKRTFLNKRVSKEVIKQAEALGIHVEWVRFVTFIRKPKIFRLMGEPSFKSGTW